MTVSVAKYANCQRAVINVFFSTAGVSVRPVMRPWATRNVSQRLYTRSSSSSSKAAALIVEQETSPKLSANDDEALSAKEEQTWNLYYGPEEATSTPWYLRVEIPQRDVKPILKHQQLPELPSDPPPLLEPILEHISTDLGLDDLTLFDLRDIDPPPALGANLLMVLGTARSEKHLHVSADRFCRWLKTTHKLSPYADGLLGRGELKLKLRRKARRARILSNVGSSEKTNVDDGIRTGWICVNVGNVPDNRHIMVHKDLHNDYVGFGEEVEGARIVIQMLTQEKREELDLEDLWGKMVHRQEKKETRISHKIEEQVPAKEVGQQLHLDKNVTSDMCLHPSSTSRMFSGPFSQTRCYHAKAAATKPAEDGKYDNNLDNDDLDSREPDDDNDLKALPADHFDLEDERFPEHQYTDDSEQSGILLTENERLSALKAHIDRLKATHPAEAREMLNWKDSPFWVSFDAIYPLFPTLKDSELRLSLLCYAEEIGMDFAKAAINGLLRIMEATFIDIPEKVYLASAKAMLRIPVSPSDLLEAATIIERMSARGHSVAIDEIRTLVQVAILQVSSASDHLRLRPDAFQRYKRLMNLYLDQPLVEAEISVMHACADTENWDAFWDVWRGFARAMRSRPRELYITMFRCTARRNHQAEAMRCLRECVPDMTYEERPVDMDAEIAEAVKACLVVAEPDIGRIASHTDALGEWASLWRRCNRAINVESVKAQR